MGIAAMSRICDSGRDSGTARHRKPDAEHHARIVSAVNRDLAAVILIAMTAPLRIPLADPS